MAIIYNCIKTLPFTTSFFFPERIDAKSSTVCVLLSISNYHINFFLELIIFLLLITFLLIFQHLEFKNFLLVLLTYIYFKFKYILKLNFKILLNKPNL